MEAYKWVELAAREGIDGAREARTFLRDLMSEDQIRAAKGMVAAFVRAGRNEVQASSANVGDG